MTESDQVLYEKIDERIALITLNRPEKKNAITLKMAQLIQRYLHQAETDETVRVIVLTGCQSVFSAGMDIHAFRKGELPIVEPEGFGGLIHACLNKPIIAAIDGIAYGGGFELALSCDLIIASRNSTFRFPETGIGLVAAQGGCARLPHRISPYIALDWLLTGRVFHAEEALRYGAISRISEFNVLSEALEIASQIGEKNIAATQAVKNIIHHGLIHNEAENFEYQKSWVDIIRRSAVK